jgi:predicted transcriptional regulator
VKSRCAREFFGDDTQPLLAYLSTKSGTVVWRRELVKVRTAERVAELLKEDWKPAEIAKELGVTKGPISQIINASKGKVVRFQPKATQKDLTEAEEED